MYYTSVIFCVLFAVFFGSSNSLKCYVCNSRTLDDPPEKERTAPACPYCDDSTNHPTSFTGSQWFKGRQCDDEFGKDESMLYECAAGYDYCLKIYQSAIGYPTRITRQCASLNDTYLKPGETPQKFLTCIERTGTHRVKSYFCHCEADGCNASHKLYDSRAAPLIVCLGFLFLMVIKITLSSNTDFQNRL